MDDLFVIEFNGAFIASFKRRGNAENAFSRCMHRIDVLHDVLRMIGLPSGHIYCES